MRAAAATLSLTVHVAVVLGALWATSEGAMRPARRPVVIELPPVSPGPTSTRISAPTMPNVPDAELRLPPDVPTVAVESLLPRDPAPVRPLPGRPGPDAGASRVAAGDLIDAAFAEDPPVLLAGAVPAYPELLRQAGVEGRVVLEAVVDTTGRVEPGTISVVWATNPQFVEPARRTLAGSLFRPGRVNGRVVRVRIRLPVEFGLRRTREE